jgi:hypothetical protein
MLPRLFSLVVRMLGGGTADAAAAAAAASAAAGSAATRALLSHAVALAAAVLSWPFETDRASVCPRAASWC